MSDDPPNGPLVAAYQFVVTLDGADAYLSQSMASMAADNPAAGFQEVSGLEATLEVLSYPEGGVNSFLHKFPTRHSWGRIVLKRGVVSDPVLWSWYEAGLFGALGARRDGSIILRDPNSQAVVGWSFVAGLAAKWTGPALNSMQNAVAIESLEIEHQGLFVNKF